MTVEKKVTTDEKAVAVKVEEKKNEKVEDVKVTDAVMKIKNISIKIPEDVHRKLKAKCAMEGQSAGNVLKRLIDEYIDGEMEADK